MPNIQALAEQLLSGLATWLPLGYAFGAGMVATVNPCGFAMLPVFLALMIGGDSAELPKSPLARARRAVKAGLVISATFVFLFSVVGAIVALGGTFLMAAVPWLAVLIGAGLILMGLRVFAGGIVAVPFLSQLEDIAVSGFDAKKSSQASVRLFTVFGIAYGISSLSCTLPIFLVVVGSALASGGFESAFMQFLSYALGMGLVMSVLALGVALFDQALIARTMSVLPYVQRLSAVLAIGAGVYILYYWFVKGQLWRI